MDESDYKLQGRLSAVETLLANLLTLVYEACGLTDAEVAGAHKAMLEQTRTASLGGPDPVENDLWAAETHEALEILLAGVEAMRAAKRSPT